MTYLQRVHVNNVATTLSAAITTTGQTSISITSATGFPSLSTTGVNITVSGGGNTEIMQVTAITGTTLTVVRAVEAVNGASTAYTFSSGATVLICHTADSTDRKLDLPATFTAKGVLCNGSTALSQGMTWVAASQTGQALIGSTSAQPSFAALNLAGSNVVSGILPFANGGGPYNSVTTNSATSGTISPTLSANNIYLAAGSPTSTAVYNCTLPSAATAGSFNMVATIGNGATWKLIANTGAKIISPYGQTSTSGSITSSNTYDVINVCFVAGGFWVVVGGTFASGTPWTFA